MGRLAFALAIMFVTVVHPTMVQMASSIGPSPGPYVPEGVPWGGISMLSEEPSPAEHKVISDIVAAVSKGRITSDLHTLQGFGSRLYRAPGMQNCTKYLMDLGGDLGLKAEYDNFTVDRGSLGVYTISNVIWTKPGSDPSNGSVYYMYAHDDAVQQDDYGALLYNVPGADDDGSGCAAVIETARVLSRYELRHTVRFCFFTAEEIGLLGSANWARRMAAAGEEIAGGIDYDMIGYSTGATDYELDLVYTAPSSDQASDMVMTNTRYGIGLKLYPALTTGSIPSDIQSFYDQGYTGVFAIEDDFSPVYHTTMDTTDYINFTLIEKCTKLSCATLATWAGIETPDVGAKDVRVKYNPLEGTDVDVATTVLNEGNVPMVNVTVEFRSDGEPFDRFTVDVPSGGSVQLNSTWTALIGRHNLSVAVDPEGAFKEIDERNNIAWHGVETNDRPKAILVTSGDPIPTGASITFDAANSFDRLDGIVDYHFEFGDGFRTTTVYPTTTHAYADDGTYEASLTVTDRFRVQDTTYLSVRVQNRPPTVTPTATKERASTYEPIGFAPNAYDPDGNVTYAWDFGDGYVSADVYPTHEYRRSGIYTVHLNVTDDDGATVNSSVTILVDDRFPTCSIRASTLEGDVSTVMTFEAICEDRDGTIASITWDLGDGTIAQGRTTNHSYARPGTYSVMLDVTDDVGNTGRSRTTAIVLDRAPVAIGSSDRTLLRAGGMVLFDGSGSHDLEGDVLCKWDFGDGGSSTFASPSHFYFVPGVYTPSIKVIDNSGQVSEIALPEITVENNPPMAGFAVIGDLVVNSTVFFDGSGSIDQEGEVALLWDLGDGADAEGDLVGYVYSLPGTYKVNLTVKDTNGDVAYADRTITIAPIPVPSSPEASGGSSLSTGLLIATNVFWIVLLILIVTFFILRSRMSRREE